MIAVAGLCLTATAQNSVLTNAAGLGTPPAGTLNSIMTQQGSGIGVGTNLVSKLGGQLVVPTQGVLNSQNWGTGIVLTSPRGLPRTGGSIVWSRNYDNGANDTANTGAVNSFFIAGPSGNPVGNYYMGLQNGFGSTVTPNYVCTITGQDVGTTPSGVDMVGSFHFNQNVLVDNSVGIGTTYPAQKLHVDNGAALITSPIASNNGILFKTTTAPLATGIGDWGIQYNVSGSGANDRGLNFWKPSGSTNAANCLLFLDDNQNVGISTGQPVAKLHVNGGAMWLTGGNAAGLPGGSGPGLKQYYDATNGYGVIQGWDYTAGSSKNLNLQISGGSVGIGLTAPTAQLHTNGSLRFEAVPLQPQSSDSRFLTVDGFGNVHWSTAGVSSSGCTTTNFVPIWTGTNQLGCSMIQQSSGLANCGTGTHSGVGIGGTPLANGVSGATCYNYALTVYGAGFASSAVWIASDKKFKSNIQSISSPLDVIQKLNGVSYSYKTEEFKDMNFPEGKTYGYIAQEMQKVLPEAVVKTDKDFLAVNYQMIIPVLTEAMKELNAKVEKAEKENADLRQQLNDICSNGCAGLRGSGSGDVAAPGNQLLQNVPNPFSLQTTIGYVINNGSTAFINVNALDGKLIKQLNITTKGSGSVTINGSELSAGTYTYSLYVDDKVIDTKIMVISATK